VLRVAARLMLRYGEPDHFRSHDGSEFAAKGVRKWSASLDMGTSLIEPGSPLEDGYSESFHGELRQELLKGKIFTRSGSEGVDRDAAAALQSNPTTRLAGLPANGTGGG
jgi:transposase InsO family protein